MIDILVADLRDAMEAAAGSRRFAPGRKSNLPYHLYANVFGRIMKEFHPRLLELSIQERLDLAAKLLSEHILELGHGGIRVLSLSARDLGAPHFDYFDRLLDDFQG